MILKIINSNSAGNAYILTNNKETLLIECGVSIKLIKRAIDFNIHRVVACLVSHSHLDHCCAAKDIIKCGIKLYASHGTLEALNLDLARNTYVIAAGKTYRIGSFKILPFDIKHDCIEPLGFLISHEETGNILFLTDSFYVEYKFSNLHNIILEANYAQEILDEKTSDGTSQTFLRNRVMKSHMGLHTAINLLKANDLSQVNNIVLVHLSDVHSDEAMFVREVKNATGKKVTIADKNMEIEFNKTPI